MLLISIEGIPIDKNSKRVKNTKSNTLTEFIHKANVKTANQVIPLKTYIQNKKVTKDDLKLLFESIHLRKDYLTRFYRLSLFIDPDKFHIYPLKPMKNKQINNKLYGTAQGLFTNLGSYIVWICQFRVLMN